MIYSTDYWDDCDCDHSCRDCEKLEKRMSDAADFFEGIFELLVKKEWSANDKASLENFLEELGHILKAKFNMDQLDIQDRTYVA